MTFKEMVQVARMKRYTYAWREYSTAVNVYYGGSVQELFASEGFSQEEGTMAKAEEKEILPKDLLDYAETGDRSSVWLEMMAEDVPQNQESLGAQLGQMQRLSALQSSGRFSGSSFGSSLLMSGLAGFGRSF